MNKISFIFLCFEVQVSVLLSLDGFSHLLNDRHNLILFSGVNKGVILVYEIYSYMFPVWYTK